MRGVLAVGMNRMNLYTVRRATQGSVDYISARTRKPPAPAWSSRTTPAG